MSACARCGLQLGQGAALCLDHVAAGDQDWAAANRIMCDFLHRRKPPPRLRPREREGDRWPDARDVA
jgi:hypothetical protein